jgi:hypothetical protein
MVRLDIDIDEIVYNKLRNYIRENKIENGDAEVVQKLINENCLSQKDKSKLINDIETNLFVQGGYYDDFMKYLRVDIGDDYFSIIAVWRCSESSQTILLETDSKYQIWYYDENGFVRKVSEFRIPY